MPLVSIESMTTQSLSLALDAASLRQQVIATNIANASTPGYAARRVTFEAVLESGLQSARGVHFMQAQRLHVEPTVADDRSGQGVQLDMEMAALAQNSLHQQALIRGLQRHLGLLATAVTEGKR